ncbi:sterol desaturase family protein [Nitriliruptoraceae bacterium ZYF776]|nr:sterol desaturase family protein [Profundirhabdus halotolerans]
MRAAVGVFLRQPTAWLLLLGALGSWTWRASLGPVRWSDLAIVAGFAAVFPLLEWVIHTSLLHWRPRTIGGVTFDPLVARKHRAHHEEPRQLDLIFIPLPALAGAAVLVGALGWAIPSARLGASFVATVVTAGLVYEWTHYLIHTDYRPRHAPYRALWRHHRLHHYKNEHYWFTVTTAGTADRLLRTQPAANAVPTSPTARDLLGTRLEPAAGEAAADPAS